MVEEQQFIPAERMKQILAFIEEKGSVQVKELAGFQQVSEATIRRDLIELEQQGTIRRTHGGAVIVTRSTSYERVYQDKTMLQAAEKKRIGVAASRYISNGDTIFLDTGTTIYQLGRALHEKQNLTVITNDLCIASSVVLHPSSELIVTGGVRRECFNVLIGSITENFVRNLRLDKVFLSADAVDVEFGVSNANFIEAEIKTVAVHAGKEVILLADKTKFGKTALKRVCTLSEVDRIISDTGLSPAIVSQMAERGMALELV